MPTAGCPTTSSWTRCTPFRQARRSTPGASHTSWSRCSERRSWRRPIGKDHTYSAEIAMPALSSIQHIVVVMLENRSFDNMLGFLYADQGNVPPLNLPAHDP